MAQRFKAKTLLSNSGVFNNEVIAPNLVYNTGNQTISGTKTFDIAPILSGNQLITGNLSLYATNANLISTGSRIDTLSGNLISTGSQIDILSGNLISTGSRIDGLSGQVVFNTGNQTISGIKTFATGVVVSGNLQVSGTGIFNAIDLNNIDNLSLSGVDITITSGIVTLTNAPILSGNPLITGNLSLYATTANLALTGSTLQTNINNLSGISVFTTGNQSINGNKTFLGNTVINNLTVTGTESIVNTTNVNIGSNFLLLNVTGGGGVHGPASDGGIFFITGSGFTGINDTGAIIGYDSPTNKWVFGLAARSSDLANLNEIASVPLVTALSGRAVFTTGDQTISGNKTFNDTIITRTISGLSGVGGNNISINLKAIDNALNIFPSAFIGGDIVLNAGSGNFAAGNIFLNAGKEINSAYRGVVNVNGNININSTLSSELASRYINIYKTGIEYGNPAAINALTIDNNNVSLNTPGGGGQGFGLLISGVQVTPNLYVNTTSNQTISGIKSFATGIDIINSGNPQSLRVFNRTGLNTGEFGIFGWNNNQLTIGAQQTNSGILRDVTLTGANININASGVLNIFDPVNITGNVTITGHLSASSKSFLINHPTQLGKKLQYGSLEGPEHGVFVRGKTSDTTINLPDYWASLVDEDSISVNLTPIDVFSNIYVVEYNNRRVVTDGNNGNDYFYTVYGERKDIPKLTVEF